MVQVELKARGVAVAQVSVPPFRPMPEVLIWGDRVFRRVRSGDGTVYAECFAYYIPEVELQKDPELKLG